MQDEPARARTFRFDGGRGKFSAYTLYSWAAGESPSGYVYSPIYVHAKVMLVDDAWIVAGSANLNERGLRTDSEIAVQAPAADLTRELRAQLWSEHLGMSSDEVLAADPRVLIDGEWKRRGEEAERCRRDGLAGPPWHAHPYRPKETVTGRLLGRMQSASLEH